MNKNFFKPDHCHQLITIIIMKRSSWSELLPRYTPDTRFSSLHKPSSEHWVLELRDTQLSDQGPGFHFSPKFSLSLSHYWHFHFLTELSVTSKYPTPNIKCSGDYECQISTTPVRSLKFLLQVVGESLNINGNFLFLGFFGLCKIFYSKICLNCCSWYSRHFNNNFAFYEWQFLQNGFLKYNDGAAANI